MKITVFTSNKDRHNHLINELLKITNEIFIIQESRELISFPDTSNFKKKKSIKKYFSLVQKAEKKIIKRTFIKSNNKKLNLIGLKFGDINNINKNYFKKFLKSDLYIIFGSSFIKGDLLKFLIKKKAINIHMGISPYYKGADCNYWAIKDNNINLVGATIHYLSDQLDGGKIIKYVKPDYNPNPFLFSMSVVKNTINEIVLLLRNKRVFKIKPKKQDSKKEIRHTKKKDFYKENVDKIIKKKIKKNLFSHKNFSNL
tara:strand:+ start:1408 stop:2175 length:768 start_codon:yes stop_codon:yes gene_type:complete